MYILGISAYYHDSAASLIQDGQIIAAAQEERFNREKHYSQFPKNAILYCLQEANITINDLDYIVFYDKPLIKFERILETYLSEAPKGFDSFIKAIPVWIKDKLYLKETLAREFANIYDKEQTKKEIKKQKSIIKSKLKFSEHHLSHAASAFFPSPFEKAAILTIDGVGEWTTTSLAYGDGNSIKIIKELTFPHSLGLLYSAFTYYLGFKVNSGEYKVMGLAPYGKPIYTELIKSHLIDIKEDGSFHLNMKYFNYTTGLSMTSQAFHELFGTPPRESETEITQREMDIAASLQKVTEEVMIKLARFAKQETGASNLCLAGGVALNCVGNGKILQENIFDDIWIQPASGDDGASLGAAYTLYHLELNQSREISPNQDSMQGSFLGPSFSNTDIVNYLQQIDASYEMLDESTLLSTVAKAITQEKVIGWFQGKMEFGPRALGHRSIIADPRSPQMQKILNLKIKYRESFRPFAPSILREKVNEWFCLDADSPYMLLVAPIQDDKKIDTTNTTNISGFDALSIPRSQVPAITHVDYSARVQTVQEETNPKYYRLIKEFERLTNCPILINTSFNVRGEPIVCSPQDAYDCFMRTQMDILVLENCILYKDKQPSHNKPQKTINDFKLD
jgi:carbamoyltransferase